PGLLPDEAGAFDLILCRNLLIYLTPAARRRALDTLERLLAPDGLLALGPAEPPTLAGRTFIPPGPAEHFLFRRGTPAKTPSPRPAPRSGEGGKAPPSCSPLPASGRGAGGVRFFAEDTTSTDTLARARGLADSGQLDDALAECLAHLGRAGPSADAYC